MPPLGACAARGIGAHQGLRHPSLRGSGEYHCPSLTPDAASGLLGGITLREGACAPSGLVSGSGASSATSPSFTKSFFYMFLGTLLLTTSCFLQRPPLPGEETGAVCRDVRATRGLGLGGTGPTCEPADEARVLPRSLPSAHTGLFFPHVHYRLGTPLPLPQVEVAVCKWPASREGRGHRAPTQRLAPGSRLLREQGLCRRDVGPGPSNVPSAVTAGGRGPAAGQRAVSRESAAMCSLQGCLNVFARKK